MQYYKSRNSSLLTRFAIPLALALGFGLTPLFAQSNSSPTGSSAPTMKPSSPTNQSASSTGSSSAPTRQSEISTAKAMVLTHWTDVANRNVPKLGNEYASDAVIAWVGGPLNGTYQGRTAIDSLWTKFAKATSAMKFTVRNISYDVSSANPTVSEDVVLTNGSDKTVHVDSTLVYQNSKIVAEVWKVNSSDSGLGWPPTAHRQ